MDVDVVLGHEGGIVSAAEDEFRSDEDESIGAVVVDEATTSTASSELEATSDLTDLYQLDVSVVVTEEQSDEIEGEFDDALTEICGEKSFPCSMCDKVCKSKGGLTRHTNSKHNTATLPKSSFCLATLSSIIEEIKKTIVKEKLYGSDMTEEVKTASCTQALFDAVCPLYRTFYRKRNQDVLVQAVFGLTPKSCQLLACKDYKAANLIMVHLTDHLVGFNRKETTKADPSSLPAQSSTKLDPVERGPLAYVAGFVVSKLFQAAKRKAGKQNEYLLLLLQHMKSPDQSSSFIAARTRGGLVNPSQELVGILEEAETSFRQHVDVPKQSLRNIPTETICNDTLSSPVVKSLWGNIVLSSGVDNSSPTQKLCLENVIKLYLKVRSFSYARDFLTKHKIKEKQMKKKALRKEMKRTELEV